jgi:hypothetical protein
VAYYCELITPAANVNITVKNANPVGRAGQFRGQPHNGGFNNHFITHHHPTHVTWNSRSQVARDTAKSA